MEFLKKKYYITTPIYYASGKPHIGHAYTSILADTFAKYKRLFGHKVFLLSGLDEHGQKINDKAKSLNMEPQDFVDQISSNFKILWDELGIFFDGFVRTTDQNHTLVVQNVFSNFYKNEDIYLDVWKGLYCVQCEENYKEKDAIHGDSGELLCKIGHKLVEKHEETYFFKFKKYQKWLETFFKENQNFIFPNERMKEIMNNFVNKGIDDLSITRTSMSWGVKVKENKNHVIYVWIDALFAYLTGLGYKQVNANNFNTFWEDEKTEIIHVIGKEITRFHAIYWPIMLHCMKLRLPSRIISHGWIITDKGKMSKSLGNIIDPCSYVEKYGADSLKYFLLKNIPIINDGIFTHKLFVMTYNNDLANNFGNFISRSLGLLNKYNGGIIPEINFALITDFEQNVINQAKDLIKSIDKYVSDFRFDLLLNKVMEVNSLFNKYIEETKPWMLKKENLKGRLDNFLNIVANLARILIFSVSPILSNGSEIAKKQFNFLNLCNVDSILDFSTLNNHKVDISKPIYQRLSIEK